ncbi:hypothetical protein CONCODRAFT_70877 [Conidiobolus coronatus NRRL 28638]|uniref:Extracellular membrane protein CFEM domain-containing protein n=1 Tax=Conidiobolus coronatus (strain ATCC 28846 / CBS 209.66 / NRRL 28638) TaxID=796925 RepID=A0A137P599_CONC2|nr:hypothetical protein CONCODRAFT_70877 [Conidiobolus coronatus NRRL 28638]|eukprot:KXN70192.1 hypothetical protein CONCODRAFT_70877 [Conidiobolus coronatus NRRL 28638]
MKFLTIAAFTTFALAQSTNNTNQANNTAPTNTHQSEVDVYTKCLSTRTCGFDRACQEGCAGLAYNQTAKYIGDLQTCIRSCNTTLAAEAYLQCYTNCDKNTNINTNIPSNSTNSSSSSNTNSNGKSSNGVKTQIFTWSVAACLGLAFMTL